MRLFAFGLVLLGLVGCGPNYSPDTYASNAVQQANKVEQGVVVGVRQVGVSASGTVGSVSGAAAGGIAGSQVGIGPVSAITALGGSLVGGFAGSAAEHVAADTGAFEYIVRKPNGELVSVTQKDKVPLALWEKVLVITGNQARVVPDYTVPPSVAAANIEKPTEADKDPGAVKAGEPVKPDLPAADTRPGEAVPGRVPNASAQSGAAAAPASIPSGSGQPASVQPASPAATVPGAAAAASNSGAVPTTATSTMVPAATTPGAAPAATSSSGKSSIGADPVQAAPDAKTATETGTSGTPAR